MDEVPSMIAGSRRNEDIALDLMKFVAMTTGYGRTTSSGAGFGGTGAAAKPALDGRESASGRSASEE